MEGVSLPLLALPLVGGYIFSTVWAGSLFHASRESGHRLYFRAVFYAVFLLICAVLIHVYLFAESQRYPAVLSHARDVFWPGSPIPLWGDVSQAATLVLAFVLGPLLGHLLNFPRRRPFVWLRIPWTEFRPFEWWERHILNHSITNNDFEKLIADSFYKYIPVLFTLTSGKVYIGWAVGAPNPSAARKSVRILPALSGYRDSEEQRLQITTNYYDVLSKVEGEGPDSPLNHVSKKELEVVIPVDQIVASHLFDISIYLEFVRNAALVEGAEQTTPQGA